MLTTFGCERSSFFSIFCLSWLKYYFLCAEYFFASLIFFSFKAKLKILNILTRFGRGERARWGRRMRAKLFFNFWNFCSVHQHQFTWKFIAESLSFVRLTVDERQRQPTLLGTTGEFSSFTKEKTSSMIRHLASKNGSRARRAEAHIMRTRLHTRIQTAVSLRAHRRAINVVWYWNIWEESGEFYAIRCNVLKLQSKH